MTLYTTLGFFLRIGELLFFLSRHVDDEYFWGEIMQKICYIKNYSFFFFSVFQWDG